MEQYDYRQAVMDDIRAYIKEHDIRVTNENREELETTLHDSLWNSDSVTGNASGSYTCDRWEAEELTAFVPDYHLFKDVCVIHSLEDNASGAKSRCDYYPL